MSTAETVRPARCWKVVVRTSEDPALVVGRFLEVWAVVASWGTWRDPPPPAQQGDEELLEQLPSWFSERMRTDHAVDLSNWLEDVVERSWIVLGVSVRNDRIEVDLSADTLPMSPWTVELVFEMLGARVVSSDLRTAGT